MTKFVSKWATENPITDVALLKYPYKPIDREGVELPGAVVASVEDAEAMCDWLWDTCNQVVGRDVVKRMSAVAKLRDAWTRQSEARAAVDRAEAKKIARQKERASRVADKDAEKLGLWEADKAAQFERLIRELVATTKKLKALRHDFNENVYDKLGAMIGTLSATTGTLKNHHFGVTSSRAFEAAMRKRQEK